MQLKYEMIDHVLIVKFTGELDHHVAEEIRGELDETIAQKRMKHLILDLSEMTFMDSSGIGVIIGRYKNITKLGGKVAVINVPEKINKIFKLAGLYHIITKYSDKNEAINCM
ncbi:anti-sigma-factor antagonist [Alkaliphilus metalliredigens QYMF]|uniref:Anti-sigma F factor antagonist n=1 Tax=Alkaliphilus metalliredigens (strain QYMF) TaxID=293826 RepID=A6TQA2_ALKMQ|nr:anti-sigma F factor antagonist [Alkaliphilus metalliredigens]ABR48370.1 anti-sigma-factor antagonist [Alkaliphilus metalliredigens QYMF]